MNSRSSFSTPFGSTGAKTTATLSMAEKWRIANIKKTLEAVSTLAHQLNSVMAMMVLWLDTDCADSQEWATRFAAFKAETLPSLSAETRDGAGILTLSGTVLDRLIGVLGNPPADMSTSAAAYNKADDELRASISKEDCNFLENDLCLLRERYARAVEFNTMSMNKAKSGYTRTVAGLNETLDAKGCFDLPSFDDGIMTQGLRDMVRTVVTDAEGTVLHLLQLLKKELEYREECTDESDDIESQVLQRGEDMAESYEKLLAFDGTMRTFRDLLYGTAY